jgi:hypothetical protein
MDENTLKFKLTDRQYVKIQSVQRSTEPKQQQIVTVPILLELTVCAMFRESEEL